jgi:uncharacterized FlaG/YvyC family protein
MDHGPDSIGKLIPLRPSARAGASDPRRLQTQSSPPPDLQADLATAQQVIADLAAQQVNLHFTVDKTTGRVRVEMLDGTGTVIREIPTRRLLDTLSGGGLLIDEQA